MNTTTMPAAPQRVHLPQELGQCFVDRQQIEPGLAVAHSHYRPARALRERSAQPAGEPSLVITLALQGESGYVADDDARLLFRDGHTTVSSFQGSSGERHYAAGATVTQLRLLVGESLLQRYLGPERVQRLLPRHGVRQLGYAPTSPAAAAHAAALLGSLHHGDGTLALHIHALSLLAEQLHTLPQLRTHGKITRESRQLSEADAERVREARALMLRHMDQPLSIAWLCQRTGLSEFKLKLGCRRLFDRTPYQLLLDLRMQRAHALLASGKQVAQAAWAVGYRHPANFSAAFARYYGRAPKSIASGI